MLVPQSNKLASSSSFIQEWEVMKEQANVLIKTGFLPSSIKTPEQCIAIMMKGKEIGMQPMQALSQINIIQGKPTTSAEGMHAVVLRNLPGSKLDVVKSTDEICEIEAARPGGKTSIWTFTIQDAKKAGLLDKDNWKKFPRAMIRNRCISETCRAVFPDAIQGLSHTTEEILDSLPDKKPVEVVFSESPSLNKVFEAFRNDLDFEPKDVAEFLGKKVEQIVESDLSILRDLYRSMMKKEKENDMDKLEK